MELAAIVSKIFMILAVLVNILVTLLIINTLGGWKLCHLECYSSLRCDWHFGSVGNMEFHIHSFCLAGLL